eukprot:4668659-Lingulodinium_polyedra.AAC.1
MMGPSLNACVHTAQTLAVGKIRSCASGVGMTVGPCEATVALFLLGNLSSTLPLTTARLNGAED